MNLDAVLSFLAAALRTATPIALATLACTISERAGVINIGIEGTMIASAFTGAVGAYYSGSAWVGLLCGAAAGILLAAIIAGLSIYCGGDQVVIGIGLNLLGPGLSYLIMYTIWGSRGTSPWLPGFSAVDIPFIQDIPVLGPLLSGHNPCIYLCIALTVLMHYVIYHTRYGLRVRAAGENPMALATVGVNVYRLRTSAVLWGGLMAGLAGASLSLGSLNVFTNGMSADKGFLAYAANRFGQWTPGGSYLAALLFGGMDALRLRLQEYCTAVASDAAVFDDAVCFDVYREKAACSGCGRCAVCASDIHETRRKKQQNHAYKKAQRMKTCQTNEKRTLAMAYFKNEFRSVLYVDDFEASTKFYGEGLELRSNYSWDDGPDDRGVKYLAAGGVIEVIRRDPPIAQGSTTLMLEAEDVNACYQAMKKKDWLIFLEDLADRPYGIRCFRLLDPNKNDIVIFSYLKDLEEKGLL